VSQLNDAAYSMFLRPWIRLAMNEPLAETIRLLHPLRMQRYLVSDLNPWLLPVKLMAEQVKTDRRPAAEDNPFAVMEKICIESMEIGLDYFRELRDRSQEYLFKSLYDNPLAGILFGEKQDESRAVEQLAASDGKGREKEKAGLRKAAGQGGFVEACIRVMTAVAGSDRIMDVREFQVAERIVQSNKKLRALTPAEFKKIVREQARIYDMAPRKAINGLREMTLSARERLEIIRIAETIAGADEGPIESREVKILALLKKVIQPEESVMADPAEKV
jgi:tellurite resistance protein